MPAAAFAHGGYYDYPGYAYYGYYPSYYGYGWGGYDRPWGHRYYGGWRGHGWGGGHGWHGGDGTVIIDSELGHGARRPSPQRRTRCFC